MSRHPRTRALLLAIAVPLVLAGCGASDSSTSSTTSTTAGAPALGPAFGSMDTLPGVLTTLPPWPANGSKLQQRLRAIGLPALNAEGEVVHIHQHLDLFVDGEKVVVPANVGIGPAFISPLHTHDETGILHVESPTASSYGLGQFFAVWGVRLDRRCIGASCAGAGKQLRAWVDGTPVDADPTRIVLAEHQEIALAYGTPAQMPKPVPSSYDFPAGL
jgi:hypothetical protein